MSKQSTKESIYDAWVKDTREGHHIPEVEIIELIVEEAYDYWERANCVEDFGLQHIGLGSIVFGGTNRLIWSYRSGFRIDESYCSPNFLKSNKDIKC